ncbi:chloroplastic group IIB intron splicing facilitator CRS2-B, chloroplastic isoform X3 [Amborella trichopoda]|uniref:chloroplastic group IIB intron splicing facilitator CRS2-B, chloroplastic isoform X3 n=1 Tax=Amborella trichopoda TaxID=13333 RepID=UPI0005D3904A|nr:chloroplastic group IIB intron splicing facilitator CRS2-B, chloroplastic isoform X3 [Amborella trichopoda]|eukprot:XP_011628462.1 chloroplastic group IIB intron splicing facilitator CRS2-B, chloroplastic isoform X3 [Amborella trichopoda]
MMAHAISIPGACISYHKFTQRRLRSNTRISVSLTHAEEVKLEYTPWLFVGLGNPGNKYHGTRHNVGFEMIDCIAQQEGISLNTIQSKALIGIGSIGEVPVLLAKPQTYMNFSGESIYDEMSLPNGVLRLQAKGGHGYHNGMKSVMDQLDNSREFPRLSIGIGNHPGTMDMRAYLLQKFSAEEREQINAALKQGVEGVRSLVFKGFDDSINRFNLRQKYKYHKV